jgi:MOSC domain-containing protein YiiM
VRCLATTANPDTGLRDADTLGALNALCGHQDFGLYARVIEPGTLSLDDTLELL